MKRVLISGGAGLIGSNIVQALCRHGGYQVIVADNLWRGKIEYLEPNGRPLINTKRDFFNLDLTSYRNCLTVTRNVDIVIHLADVVAGIDFVFSNQYFVFQQNIQINTSILKAAIENNVEKFLYVGTACSYPADKQARITETPLKEEDAYPANPESGYGWSKLMGEYELGLAADEGLIEASILRLHNVYGPPSEVDPYRSQVIPALCRKAVEFPKSEFLVWGSGRQRRAFVFVSDVVDAILRSLDYGFGKGVIQIGPSESISIAEVAQKIKKISGKPINIKFDLSRNEGDVDRKADSSKAKRILGWEPQVSFDEGLEKTYQWVANEVGRYSDG